MYYVFYNRDIRAWLVINQDTFTAHSCWDNSLDARIAARDLNAMTKRTQVYKGIKLVYSR